MSTFYFVQIKILVVVEFRIKVFISLALLCFLPHKEVEAAQFIHIQYVQFLQAKKQVLSLN